jgi:hypothetical protein
MNSMIEHYQKIARSNLSDTGNELSKEFTFGWGGPIEWAIDMFPYIETGIENLTGSISDLPICVFQSRDLIPKNMIAVVPYTTPDGNPTNTRVLPAGEASPNILRLVTVFSQAFLFLISSGGLPSPMEKEEMTKSLISLTNRRLIMA